MGFNQVLNTEFIIVAKVLLMTTIPNSYIPLSSPTKKKKKKEKKFWGGG